MWSFYWKTTPSPVLDELPAVPDSDGEALDNGEESAAGAATAGAESSTGEAAESVGFCPSRKPNKLSNTFPTVPKTPGRYPYPP